MTPAEQRTLSAVRAELARLARYDDESVVHDAWIRQRYQGGYAETYALARKEAVVTAWHEAGHAVAALTVGARFSSASVRAGGRSTGRVHSVTGGGAEAFVIAAAGQVAEGLRDWTLPSSDAQVRAWLASWRDDGGDARRFWAGLAGTRFSGDEAAAWRHCVALLTPLRLQVAALARGLLAWPRHLPYAVAAELAGFGAPARKPAGQARVLTCGRAGRTPPGLIRGCAAPLGETGAGTSTRCRAVPGDCAAGLRRQPKTGGRRSRKARTPSV